MDGSVLGQKFLDVAYGCASGHFSPAALPANLFARFRYENGFRDDF